MKTIFYIPMLPENILKIEKGIKTTTLRTQSAAKKIGIPVGQTVKAKIGKKHYLVKNLGLLTIEEAGGKKHIYKTECFGKNGPIFQSTKNWIEGSGKLFVYLIIKSV